MALKTLLLLRPPLQLLKEGQRRKRVSLVLENQRNQDLLLVLHLILPLLLHLERKGGRDVLLLHPLAPVLLDLRHPRLRLGGPHAGRLGQSVVLLVAQRVLPRKPPPPLHLVSVMRSEVSMMGRTRSGASTLTSASATVAAR